VPAEFRVERLAPPDSIAEAVRISGAARLPDDWSRARALAGVLLRHARDEGPIRADLETTYRGIVAGKGYCADFVRVYLAAARSADLFCRQWAFSFDGYGGHGHTFVEVFDRQRSAWTFLDVFNNVFAVHRGDETPLPAAEVRVAMLAAPESIEFCQAAEGRMGYPHADKLVDYYRRGAAQWYLWFGNDVVTRERAGLTAFLARWSGLAAHRIGGTLGGLPTIVAIVDSFSEPALARAEALRTRVRRAGGCLALLVLLLLPHWWLRRG